MNDRKHDHDRGYITVATGKEEYYKVAYNLLQSYRKCTKDPLPFAILADRENAYTKPFDDVVLINNPTYSFLDKLLLADFAPYDETVFIDADSLCVSNPDDVFDDFKECGDFSFYGCTLPFDSQEGWFDYSKCGKYKEKIHFHLCGHGGLYYIRKTEKSRQIADLAKGLCDHFYEYGFNHANGPADEPVLALAMAIEGSLPCSTQPRIQFCPYDRSRFKVDRNGEFYLDGKSKKIYILHFGMKNTPYFAYNWLLELIQNDYYVNDERTLNIRYRSMKLRFLPDQIKARTIIRGKLFSKKVIKKIIMRTK